MRDNAKVWVTTWTSPSGPGGLDDSWLPAGRELGIRTIEGGTARLRSNGVASQALSRHLHRDLNPCSILSPTEKSWPSQVADSDRAKLERIEACALLHDIGKLGIGMACIPPWLAVIGYSELCDRSTQALGFHYR